MAELSKHGIGVSDSNQENDKTVVMSAAEILGAQADIAKQTANQTGSNGAALLSLERGVDAKQSRSGTSDDLPLPPPPRVPSTPAARPGVSRWQEGEEEEHTTLYRRDEVFERPSGLPRPAAGRPASSPSMPAANVSWSFLVGSRPRYFRAARRRRGA